jgi:thymidylate kinase
MRGIRRWGRMLDVIIWLDAPDDVLADRIRGRRKAHRAKESGDAELGAFLAKYRRAYDWVIDQFAATGRTRLYRFDTSELSIDRLADVATSVIEGAARA